MARGDAVNLRTGVHYSFWRSNGHDPGPDSGALYHSAPDGIDGGGITKVRADCSLCRPFLHPADGAMPGAVAGGPTAGIGCVTDYDKAMNSALSANRCFVPLAWLFW